MRFPRKLTGLLVAAGMAVGITAAAAPARAATAFPYLVFYATADGSLSGECLEADPGPDFAYRVYTQPCDRQNPAQEWVPMSQGSGIYKFANEGAGGWCLDAHVPTPSIDAAPVILWSCSATFSDERWRWGGGVDFYQSLHSAAWNTTGYCLTVLANLTTTPGVSTELGACNNPARQDFLIDSYSS